MRDSFELSGEHYVTDSINGSQYRLSDFETDLDARDFEWYCTAFTGRWPIIGKDVCWFGAPSLDFEVVAEVDESRDLVWLFEIRPVR